MNGKIVKNNCDINHSAQPSDWGNGLFKIKKQNNSMYYNWLLIIFCFFTSFNSFSQLIFHQETFRGGITGAGFSTALSSGNGSFDIYIEPGSTIKKAWLFAQRIGISDSVNIIINGTGYNFNSQNQVT